MDVEIGEVTTNVRAIDGGTPLSPKTMQQIIRAVKQALRDDHEHDQRAEAERRVASGHGHD